MTAPLVLLPGMNCSTRLWSPVLAHSLGASREVYLECMDRHAIEAQVDALLDRLPARFAIGGLSLGAIVAMAVHRRAPERVLGLFLVATNARPPTPDQRAEWRAQLQRLSSGATARELQAAILPLLLGRDPNPVEVAEVLTMAEEVGRDVLISQLRLQLSRVDERGGLARSAVPCTVVAPELDSLCPLDRHAEIHRLVARSRMVRIPGAAHLVTLQNPTAVAIALGQWLKDVDHMDPQKND